MLRIVFSILLFYRWPIPGLFFFIFVFSIVQLEDKIMPMTGFELQISVVGSDRFTNWATITAQLKFWVKHINLTIVNFFSIPECNAEASAWSTTPTLPATTPSCSARTRPTSPSATTASGSSSGLSTSSRSLRVSSPYFTHKSYIKWSTLLGPDSAY